MRKIAAAAACSAARGRIGLLVIGALMLVAPATASASIVASSQAGSTLVAQNTGTTSVATSDCYPILAENGTGYLPCEQGTFTGASWSPTVTADGGRGNGAYYQMPGSQWVGQYNFGSISDSEWTQFQTTFDRPAGASLGVRVLVDNEVTGIWVNGNQLSDCTRAEPCTGFNHLPFAFAIPDADLQDTGNQLNITVLNNYPNAITSGGLDFQVVTRGPFVLKKAANASGNGGSTLSTSGSFQESFEGDASTPMTITADNAVGTFVDHGDGTWTWTYPSSQAGSGTIHVTATDANGLSATDSFTYSVAPPPDSTPPVIVPTVTGTQGNGGWYTSDVGVSWSVTDPESAISSQSGCGDQSVTSDTGGVTFTCTATSAGGTSTKSVTIKRDATAPSVSVSHSVDGNSGWNVNSPVAETVKASDGGSGLTADGPSCTVDGNPVSVTSSGDGEWTFSVADDGTHAVSCSASDNAGNSNPATDTTKIDTTPPLVSYAGNAGAYTVADSVNITCSASDPQPGSGMASDTCQNISGDGYTFALGTNSYSATGTDNAGNVGHGQTSFTLTVDTDSLCTLTKRWVTNPGIAGALCAKLDAAKASIARGDTNSKNGQLDAYRNQLSAQSDKSIPADKVAILTKLSQAI